MGNEVMNNWDINDTDSVFGDPINLGLDYYFTMPEEDGNAPVDKKEDVVSDADSMAEDKSDAMDSEEVDSDDSPVEETAKAITAEQTTESETGSEQEEQDTVKEELEDISEVMPVKIQHQDESR